LLRSDLAAAVRLAREQFTTVIEDDNPVAEQAPALLRV